MTNPTIAVLGTGRIGKMHAELIARQVPGLDLLSVFDVYARIGAGGWQRSRCRRGGECGGHSVE